MNGDMWHLVGHLSRVLRACEVILAENNEDVFVNNASESWDTVKHLHFENNS